MIDASSPGACSFFHGEMHRGIPEAQLAELPNPHAGMRTTGI